MPTPAPRYPSAAAAATTVFAQKLTPTIYQHITPTTRWRCMGNYACVSPKRHDRTLPNFLCMSPAAVARFSSGGVAIRYVLPVQCSVIFPAVGAMAQATEVAYSSTRCARRQHGFHMAAYSQTNSPWRSRQTVRDGIWCWLQAKSHHHAKHDKTVLSVSRRVRFGGVNCIPDNSRLSPTENLIAIAQFTPPRQTRHRQDRLVVSGVAM